MTWTLEFRIVTEVIFKTKYKIYRRERGGGHKTFSMTETKVRFALYLLHNTILMLGIKNQHIQSLSWLKQTHNVHHLYQMKETTK